MATASPRGWNAQTWAATLSEIFRRALEDDDFRQRCLEDGNGVLEEISGVAPPPGTSIKFFEKVDVLQIALPPKPLAHPAGLDTMRIGTQLCFPWGSN